MRRFKCLSITGTDIGAKLRLERGEDSHLFKTLRAADGDIVELMDGKGGLAQAKVVPGKELEIVSMRKAPPPETRLHLFIAPPRRQKMDQILRQAAELGIWRIVPMSCLRSVSLPDEDSVSGRWEDVLFDACKQSGNPFAPELQAPLPFSAAIELASRECGLMMHGSPPDGSPSRDSRMAHDMALFIGPEGGFSPEEIAALEANGSMALSAGRWTLRVETAAICGAAIMLKQGF